MKQYENILDYRYDKYTSTGNDGIIELIFNRLNIETGIFVEFGAWDGLHGCNCKKLVDEGWSGVFIEPKWMRFFKLYYNYMNNKKVQCVRAFIDTHKNRFDNVVQKYLNGTQIHFCSIDIDGLDLDVFETFEIHSPLVVCMEGGQMVPPFHERLSQKIAAQNIQQSLSVIAESATRKGYSILCSYQDTFLIKREFYNRFNVTDDLVRMYFDGLKAHYRRLPFIQKCCFDVDISNSIVNDILGKSDFEDYDYERRKEWAIDVKDVIYDVIEERYDQEIRHS